MTRPDPLDDAIQVALATPQLVGCWHVGLRPRQRIAHVSVAEARRELAEERLKAAGLDVQRSGEILLVRAPRWFVRNVTNPALILTASDDWKPERMIGPGGYKAKTFATEEGAAKHGTPERVTS